MGDDPENGPDDERIPSQGGPLADGEKQRQLSDGIWDYPPVEEAM